MAPLKSEQMLTSFADGSLFGQRIGNGSPKVLALHGWGGSSQQMVPALGDLDGISIDLPGFGASPAPGEVWGAKQYAEALLPVISTFEEMPVIVGFSFGGRVALSLAANYPDFAKSIVLTGAPLLRRKGTGKTPLAFRLAKLGHRVGIVSDQKIEAERRKRGSADYRNASGIMRNILVKAVNETYEAELSNLHVPLRMIWGRNDTAAPSWIPDAAAAMVPSGYVKQVEIIEHTDHYLPVTHPELINAVTKAALS